MDMEHWMDVVLVVQQAASSWRQWTNSPLPCVWHRYEIATLISTRSRLLWDITQKYQIVK